MTNEMTNSSKSVHMNYAIGARLKSARETLGFNTKDVASQLRLHEKLISMLENDTYPDDLPMIFVRGYIRSYGKFVELPDYVIKEALKPVQPPVIHVAEPEPKPKFEPVMERPVRNEPMLSRNSKKLIMRAFTCAIVFTLTGLLWMWWHNHTALTFTMRTPEHVASTVAFGADTPSAAHESATQTTSQAPVQAGASDSGLSKIPLAPQVNNALSSAATKPVATGDLPTTNHLAEPMNEADELVTIESGSKVSISSKAMAENEINNDESNNNEA